MLRQVDLWFECDELAWSERYYFDGAHGTPTGTLDALVQERVKFAARPTILRRGRAFNIGQPASMVKKDLDMRPEVWPLVFTVPVIDPSLPADSPHLALGAAFATDTGGKRMCWFSGIPRGQIQPSQRKIRILVHAWTILKVTDFVNQLVAEPFNLQIRQRKAPPAVPFALVDAIDTDPNGLYRLTTRGPHSFEAGMPVAFRGTKGRCLTRLRGERRVRGIPSPTSVVLDRGPLPEVGPLRYTGGGSLTALQWDFQPARWVPLIGPAYQQTVTGFHNGSLVLFKTITTTCPFVLRGRLRGWRTPARRGRARQRSG